MPTSRCWCPRTTSARTSSRCSTSPRCSTCWTACSCCCAKAATTRLAQPAGQPRAHPADAGIREPATHGASHAIDHPAGRAHCAAMPLTVPSPTARLGVARMRPHRACRDACRWRDARQMVLVTTPDWNADHGTLRTFERDGAGWRAGRRCRDTGDRRQTASAWGLGLHPAAARDGPLKREGDGRSPAGVFAHRRCLRLCRACRHRPALRRDAAPRLLHRCQRIAAVQPHRRCAAWSAPTRSPVRPNRCAATCTPTATSAIALGFVIEHNPQARPRCAAAASSRTCGNRRPTPPPAAPRWPTGDAAAAGVAATRAASGLRAAAAGRIRAPARRWQLPRSPGGARHERRPRASCSASPPAR